MDPNKVAILRFVITPLFFLHKIYGVVCHEMHEHRSVLRGLAKCYKIPLRIFFYLKDYLNK